MTNLKIKSIDEYIAQSPLDTQKVLEELRALIREAAPKVTEKISYGMPKDLIRRIVKFRVRELTSRK